MAKFYDGLGKDVTHYVQTLQEQTGNSKAVIEGLEEENLKLKAEIKRLKRKKE